MRAFAAKLLLASVPLLVMAGANYVIDPANLFHHGVEADVVRLLVNGNAVAGVDGVNDRILQREYVRTLAAPPAVVVLGSSRAFQIRASEFPGHTFWNHGVSGASLEDLVAMAGLYRMRGLTPGAAVLVLDPWILNRFNGQQRWKVLTGEYDYMAQAIGIGHRWWPTLPPMLTNYAELLSPAYFQESLKRRNRHTAPPHVVSPRQSEELTLLPDGSWQYWTELRERSAEEAARHAALYASEKPIYSLGTFHHLDPEAQRDVAALVRSLVGAGSRVSLVLAPYHPVVYAAFEQSDDYHMVIDAEAWFRRLAADTGVSLVGSYDPARAGCGRADFLDGMHSRPSCINRILARRIPD